MAAVKVRMLDMWTSSFHGDASDLILLLEEDGGKKNREALLPWASGRITVQLHLDVC